MHRMQWLNWLMSSRVRRQAMVMSLMDFPFLVSSDVRWERVGGSESFGEVFTNVDGDESF